MAQQTYVLLFFLLLIRYSYGLKTKRTSVNTVIDEDNGAVFRSTIRKAFDTDADIYVVNRFGGQVNLPVSDNPKGQIILVLAPTTIKNVGTNPYMTKIIAEAPACYEKTFDPDRQSKEFLRMGKFANSLVELNGVEKSVVQTQLVKQPKLEWKLSRLCKFRTFYMGKKAAVKKCRQLQAKSRKPGKWAYMRVIEPAFDRSFVDQCPVGIYMPDSSVMDHALPLQSEVWRLIDKYSARKKQDEGADEFLVNAAGLEEDVASSENAAGQIVKIQQAPVVMSLSSLNPEHTIIINKASGTNEDGSEVEPISVLMPHNWHKKAKLWVIDGGQKNAKLRFYQR